jgi:uncharacterized protein
MDYSKDDTSRQDGFKGAESQLSSKTTLTQHMIKIYGWMFLGLAITAGMAVFTATSSLKYLAYNPIAFLVLAFSEFGLVWYLSSRVMSMRYENAAAWFVVYSGLNGLTLSVIFFRYELGSIAMVFVIAAVFFGSMSIYGLVTKQDLTNWGSLLFAGLIGIIVATVVNLFLRSDSFMLVISYIGVAIFLGLTAYDTNKLKEIYGAYRGTDKENNIAIIGALTLYLDFINLFLFILRILGRKR